MSATLIRRILCELEELVECKWDEVRECRAMGSDDGAFYTLKRIRDLKSVIRATRKELFKTVEFKEVTHGT